MPKTDQTPPRPDPETPPATPPAQSEADRLLGEAAANRKPLTGIQNAVEALRRIDEAAHVLWTTTGPRRTHTEEIAGVLVEFPDTDDASYPSGRRIVVVLGYSSGAFKLFIEVDGKTADEQIADLIPTA